MLPSYFLIRADPFPEGCKISIYEVASKNVSIPLNLIITLKALYSIFQLHVKYKTLLNNLVIKCGAIDLKCLIYLQSGKTYGCLFIQF